MRSGERAPLKDQLNGADDRKPARGGTAIN